MQKHLSKLLIAEDPSFDGLQNPIKKKMNSHSYGHSLGKLTLSSDLMDSRIIRSTFRNNTYKKEGKESRIVRKERLGCAVITTETSATPMGSSETGWLFRVDLCWSN